MSGGPALWEREDLWDDSFLIGRRYAAYLVPGTRACAAALCRKEILQALEAAQRSQDAAVEGRLLWLLGRAQPAVQRLEKALERDPDDARARAFLGVALAGRDPARAQSLLRQAVERDPSAAWARVSLAALLFQDDRMQACLAQADAFLAQSPAVAAARFLRARALLALGRADAAEQEAHRLIESAPEAAGGYELRSRARLARGDFEGAFLDHGAVRERDPDLRFVDLGALGAATGAGRWTERVDLPRYLARIDEALARHPRAAFLWSERAEILRDPLLCRFDEALEDYRRAESLAPGQAWLQAHLARAEGQILGLEPSLARLDRAAALAPASGWIRAWRGEVARRLHREAEALEDFEKAAALMPWYGYTHAWRGALLLGLGRAEEALAALDLGVDLGLLSPTRELALFTRHWARRKAGDGAGAVADLTAAFLADPKYAWVGGSRPAARSEYAQGLAELDRVLEAGSSDPWAYAWRGYTRLQSEDHAGAAADLARASALDPRNAWFAAWSALACRQAAGPAAAAPQAARALALDPAHALAALLLCEAYEAQGRLEEALELLTRSAERAGTSAPLFFRRGSLQLRLGRPALAVEDLRRALRLDRGYADAHALLARALLELGDARGARAEAEAALERQPESTVALLARGMARGALGDAAGQIEDLRGVYRRDKSLFGGADRALLAVLEEAP